MELVSTLLENLLSYLLTLRLTDLLDIAVMAYIFYRLIAVVRRTKMESLFKGVLILLLVLWLSAVFQLHGVNHILNKLVEWGVLALIILFQPEIRHLLEQMGSSEWKRFNVFSRVREQSDLEQAINQTVLACADMAQSRTGVLLVFEREMMLDDMVQSGTVLDATVSSELLKNIFFINAPMHDGAAIVRNGRLLAAGCMLPLSQNVNLSRDLGMRHRAGIGMSEHSDAVVVIVSEETGSISVAVGGMLKRHLMPETLEKFLRNELIPQETQEADKQSRLPWKRKRGGKTNDGE